MSEDTTVLAKKDETVVAPTGSTPTELLQLAISKDLDVDKLERLMDMQERWAAAEAHKAFIAALSTFQTNCSAVTKDATVDYGSGSKRTTYNHATLQHVVAHIGAPLREAGLAYRFEMPEGDRVSVTCIITHADGHSERTTMSAPPDNSGSKNPIQACGSTVTYLQRYTLLCALGIVTADEDNDANNQPEPVELINKTEVAAINGLLNRLPDTVKTNMLGAYKISTVEEMPASNLPSAMKALNKHIDSGETAV